MKIILPCCGRSSRYPNQPPKWLLPAYDGRPMIQWSVCKLDLSGCDLVMTILQEHEDQFKVSAGVKEIFRDQIELIVLKESTSSQAETVARTIEHARLTGPILIKDSDNAFEFGPVQRDFNYVCVDSLNNHDEINPRNKSYVAADHSGRINNIREKNVISDTFSVGGYYFTCAQQFLETYTALQKVERAQKAELYVSDIVGSLISKGVPFFAERVKGYQDWGTIHEWRKFLNSNSGLFVSLDGFVFTRGSKNFEPRFENTVPNREAVQALKELSKKGQKIVYLTIRDESYAEVTRRQMAEAGLPPGPMVFDCPSGRWKFIGSPHPTLPTASFTGLEIDPADPALLEKIKAT
jgi:dTDP-glucose pyrophosphorylase